MKTCKKCNEIKSLADFYEGKSQCKLCIKRKNENLTEEQTIKRKESSRKSREKNREKAKAYSKERYANYKENNTISEYKLYPKNDRIKIIERNKKRNKENTPLYLWRSAKARSKIKNLEFNIEVSDIIVPEFCPILGLRLEVNRGIKDNSISLDRVDPSKGYIKGNILVISYLANAMKRNADLETLQKFAAWVLSLESL